MHVLGAADKFRGTATAAEIADAVVRAATAAGAGAEAVPMADGGEGLLEVFGRPNRTTTVTDALGRPVEAAWWSGPDGTAVVETARSNGLALIGGAQSNDPVNASTAGVGALLADVLATRPTRVVVGVGGSATTDGGAGAVEELARRDLLVVFAASDVRVACDVTTRFTAAAEVFGPQKGADATQVRALTERLHGLRGRYRDRFGVDPETVPGAGAAGGLAGALAVLGATLEPGVDVVARQVGLDDALTRADLVVTGEGRLDRTSLQGKVVGGVLERAERLGRSVLVVCGIRADDVDLPGVEVVSLVERFGADVALGRTTDAVEQVVRDHLATLGRRPG